MSGITQALVGGYPTPDVQLIGVTRNTTSGTTFTFNNVNFGRAATDRHIVVVSSFVSASQIVHNSMTVGGVSATGIVVRPLSVSAGAIYLAKVSTGTTGTVSISMSGTATEMSICVFSIIGMGDLTGTGNSNGLTGSPASISTTLDTEYSGVAIASTRRGGTSVPTLSATTNTLKDSQTYATSSNSQQYRAGYFFPTLIATPDTFSSTSDSATGSMTLLVAFFI